LGQYVQGFEGNYGSPSYAYTNAYRDGFDYLQRLMRAAAAVDDPSLRSQMRDAKFLSHLVNLGGAYAACRPVSSGSSESAFELLWRSSDIIEGSYRIKEWFANNHDPVKTVKFAREILASTREAVFLNPQLKHDAQYLGIAISAGRNYIDYPNWIASSEPLNKKQFPLSSNKFARCFPDEAALEAFLAKGSASMLAGIASLHHYNFCLELLQALFDCQNDLEIRLTEMLNDMRSGQKLFLYNLNSWFGHKQRYGNIQAMMDRMLKFWDQHCGSGVLELTPREVEVLELVKYKYKAPAPEKPLSLAPSDYELPSWATAGAKVVGGAIIVYYSTLLPPGGEFFLQLTAKLLGLGFRVQQNF
jgi:hypothetical protein